MPRIGSDGPVISPPDNQVSTDSPSRPNEAPPATGPGDGIEAPKTHLPLAKFVETGSSIAMRDRATLGVSSAGLALDSQTLARNGDARAAYMNDAKAVYSALPGFQEAALKPDVGIGSAAVVLALYFVIALVVVVNITVTETETSGPQPPEPGPTTLQPGQGWQGTI